MRIRHTLMLSIGLYGLTSCTGQQENLDDYHKTYEIGQIPNVESFRTLHIGALLREESDDPELASHVMHDYRQADLDSQTRSMLDFAVKLTRDPGSMEESDVQGLRQHGLSDEQILSVVLITCLFNFMTRLADGLGVDIPESHQQHVESWIGGPAARQDWLMKPKA